MIVVELDMPKTCNECPFRQGSYCGSGVNENVRMDYEDIEVTKPKWCPILIPEDSGNGAMLRTLFPYAKLDYDDFGNRYIVDKGQSIASTDWW